MNRRFLVLLIVLMAGCAGRAGEAPKTAGALQTLEHQGRTRSFLLRLPRSIPRGARLPLVLVLHGGGGNAENAERMTGFTPLARSENFIVVYPEGTSRGRSRLLTWNAGHCCGYAMQSRVDDVGFLGRLIDEISRQYPVDADRVFVTGMSNGAMMTHRAGIELGAKIAAIAPVVGALFGDEPSSRGRVSALMINGMLDGSVPYAGGPPGGRFADSWDGSPVRPALEQGVFWAKQDGCSAPATTERSAYVQVRYSCPDRLGVELYAIRTGGHAWPGGERGSQLGDEPSRALDATRVIWQFFATHPKR